MTASTIRRAAAALAVTALAAAAPARLSAQAIRNDPGFTTTVTPRNDDVRFGFDLPFSITWDGLTTNHLTVSNNGYIGVGETSQGIHACTGNEPGGFAATCADRVFMAFNTDLDSRGSGTSPMTYGMGTVDGRQAFGANWFDFGYYPNGGPVLNFQLVLIDRSDANPGDFAVEFNYGAMPTNPGGRSGWVSPNGYGMNTAFESAAQENGRTQFTVDGGVASGITSVEPSASAVVPEPSTYVLMGSGLLGLAGVARRRRHGA